MEQKSMFRAAALKAQQGQDLGGILLVRPMSFTIFTCAAAGVAIVVFLFVFLATYTKRNTVSGQLVPDLGLVKVFATQPGIVIRKAVVEGQQVRKGQVLYVLSSERRGASGGSVQATISRQLSARRDSLSVERGKTRQVQEDDRIGLQRKISALEAELAKLESQLTIQERRTKLADQTLERYRELLHTNFISASQFQQKEEELLDQRSKQEGIGRERLTLQRELAQERNGLTTLALRQQNDLAQIDRSITVINQDLEESEGKRELQVTAPEAGIATAINAEGGQAVDGSKPLLSIMPTGAVLVAHLYAPSRAVGFIKAGNSVQLRYQAFPYQKFGRASGTIISVSKTAESSSDLAAIGSLPSFNGPASEPVYVIRVRLASQHVNAYGSGQPLQAGMLLDADVLQESRRLYEWVLEPLYSITGKL